MLGSASPSICRTVSRTKGNRRRLKLVMARQAIQQHPLAGRQLEVLFQKTPLSGKFTLVEGQQSCSVQAGRLFTVTGQTQADSARIFGDKDRETVALQLLPFVEHRDFGRQFIKHLGGDIIALPLRSRSVQTVLLRRFPGLGQQVGEPAAGKNFFSRPGSDKTAF